MASTAPKATNLQASKNFAKFFEKKDQRKDNAALERAQHAMSTQPKFWQSIRKRLRKQELERVDKVIQSYEVEHSIASLEHLVGEYLPSAEDAKNELYDRRQKGGKAVSTNVQQFASTFAEFLGAYSQVMDIMNAADAQFGGVAVQTLTLLLVVAVNKQKKEDLIEQLLAKLKNHFPHLQVLRSIYPTPKMEELVARVYVDVLSFSQMAAEYYRKPALARVGLAIMNPPQIGVKVVADRIVGELAEVKEERDNLLNARVYNLENSLANLTDMVCQEQGKTTEIEKKVTKVERSVNEIHQHENEDLLGKLRDAIIPDHFSCTKQLEDYQSELQACLKSKKLPVFSIEKIAHNGVYQTWRQSKKSRTVILRGGTKQIRSPLSWLSPAAVELVKKLRVEEGSEATVAYHFCRRESMVEDDHMHTAIARIIYQLLEQRPSILQARETYNSYTRRLNSIEWGQKDMKAVCEFLVDVLSHFKLVYLILDRPEDCKAGETGLSKLLQEVKRTKCVFKGFVIVDKDRTTGGQVDFWVDPGTVDVIDNLDQE